MSYILMRLVSITQGNKPFQQAKVNSSVGSKVVSDNFDSGVNSILEDDTGALPLLLGVSFDLEATLLSKAAFYLPLQLPPLIKRSICLSIDFDSLCFFEYQIQFCFYLS
jgi:hypothetical protein